VGSVRRSTPLNPGKPLKRYAAIQPSGKRMRQSRSTGKPTKAEAKHMGAVKEGGCVACEQNGALGLQRCDGPGCDASHLLSGGLRIGHAATLGECSWHHRGVPPEGYSNPDATAAVFGPSRHHHGKTYHATYGSDAELLAPQAMEEA
jgi:hypothetical protein